jgi:hypothetical protein
MMMNDDHHTVLYHQDRLTVDSRAEPCTGRLIPQLIVKSNHFFSGRSSL